MVAVLSISGRWSDLPQWLRAGIPLVVRAQSFADREEVGPPSAQTNIRLQMQTDDHLTAEIVEIAHSPARRVVKAIRVTEGPRKITLVLSELFPTHVRVASAVERFAAEFSLSEAERRVFSLLVAGHSASESAHRLCVATKTVEHQLHRIRVRTHTSSQAELLSEFLFYSFNSPSLPADEQSKAGIATNE